MYKCNFTVTLTCTKIIDSSVFYDGRVLENFTVESAVGTHSCSGFNTIDCIEPPQYVDSKSVTGNNPIRTTYNPIINIPKYIPVQDSNRIRKVQISKTPIGLQKSTGPEYSGHSVYTGEVAESVYVKHVPGPSRYGAFILKSGSLYYKIIPRSYCNNTLYMACARWQHGKGCKFKVRFKILNISDHTVPAFNDASNFSIATTKSCEPHSCDGFTTISEATENLG